MAQQNTLCETSTDKKIVMDGERLSGVQSFSIQYDASNPVVYVTLTMAIKRDSFSVQDDVIKFDTVRWAGEEGK